MTHELDHEKNLAEIRALMEQSKRFLSLSGLSGVFAGIFALLGASAAYLYLDIGFTNDRYYDLAIINNSLNASFLVFFLIDSMTVLILTLGVGFYFTFRNARRRSEKINTRASRSMLINLFIPLIAGGLFCLALVFYHIIYLVPQATLIFYGLALLNGGKYTLNDVRYLGVCEILLGLIACIFIGYGLIFWAIGFGILHIIYGTVMYFKYENAK